MLMPRTNLPSPKHIEAFEAAARLGSLAAAAHDLHLTAAAVSQRVTSLEAILGFSVFERAGNTITLTPSGASALARLAPLLSSYRQTVAALVDVGDVARVSVTAPVSIASRWLAPRLAGFAAERPDIAVELHGVTTRVRLDANEADIALHYALDPSEELPRDMAVDPLMSEAIFPVAAPQLAGLGGLQLAEIAAMPLVHDLTAIRFRLLPDWPRWLEAAGVAPTLALRGLRLSPSSLVLDAATAGAGLALGRGALVADALADGQLVRPVGESYPLRFDYFMSYHRRPRGGAAVSALVAWLKRAGAVTAADPGGDGDGAP